MNKRVSEKFPRKKAPALREHSHTKKNRGGGGVHQPPLCFSYA